jgi:hypothetical protein
MSLFPPCRPDAVSYAERVPDGYAFNGCPVCQIYIEECLLSPGRVFLFSNGAPLLKGRASPRIVIYEEEEATVLLN